MPFTRQEPGTPWLRLRRQCPNGSKHKLRRDTEDAGETSPGAFAILWLVQTEPLAKVGVLGSQLLRQELAKPLVFRLELDKICQLIAGRLGLGALGVLLLDRLRSTFPMIVGLL